jgi:hypothetical protein
MQKCSCFVLHYKHPCKTLNTPHQALLTHVLGHHAPPLELPLGQGGGGGAVTLHRL